MGLDPAKQTAQPSEEVDCADERQRVRRQLGLFLVNRAGPQLEADWSQVGAR